MSRKNYSVDEVIRSLSKKGCVITLDQPITKVINRQEMPSQAIVDEKFQQYGLKNVLSISSDIIAIGVDKTSEKWVNKFREEFPALFAPKLVKETIIIQHPFTVNISQARELGNGSWGKIDFLTTYNGFTLVRSV